MMVYNKPFWDIIPSGEAIPAIPRLSGQWPLEEFSPVMRQIYLLIKCQNVRIAEVDEA